MQLLQTDVFLSSSRIWITQQACMDAMELGAGRLLPLHCFRAILLSVYRQCCKGGPCMHSAYQCALFATLITQWGMQHVTYAN